MTIKLEKQEDITNVTNIIRSKLPNGKISPFDFNHHTWFSSLNTTNHISYAKYYLGAKQEKYSDDEMSFVLTSILHDFTNVMPYDMYSPKKNAFCNIEYFVSKNILDDLNRILMTCKVKKITKNGKYILQANNDDKISSFIFSTIYYSPGTKSGKKTLSLINENMMLNKKLSTSYSTHKPTQVINMLIYKLITYY